MEKIETSTKSTAPSAASDFEREIVSRHHHKKRMVKGFLNYAGIFVGVLLMFVVVIIVTTDFRLATKAEIAALGLDFFLLLFISYSMYVSCSDSGMRAGLQSESYTNILSTFESHKKHIIDNKMQVRLGEFCCHYISEELRMARTTILAVVGFSFDEYMEKYVGKDKLTIMCNKDLSKSQKKAIIKANRLEPVKLTPEMIMKRGRGSDRRAPLGIKPETKKGINYGTRFFTTIFISFGLSVIIFEAFKTPSWIVLAACAIKLVTVTMHGFSGYKYGYENIVFDTTYYISDQADLLQQAIQFSEQKK